jgi:aspartokinase
VNDNVIVVVSAMSSTIKSEGTTTRLIQAAQHAVKGQVAEYRRLLNLILTSHLVAIHEAMGATEACFHSCIQTVHLEADLGGVHIIESLGLCFLSSI